MHNFDWKELLKKAGCLGIVLLFTCLPFIFTLLAYMISDNEILDSIAADICILMLCSFLYIRFRFIKQDGAFHIHSEFNMKVLGRFLGLYAIVAIMLHAIFDWITQNVSSLGMEERQTAYENTDLGLIVIFSLFIAPICEEVMFRMFLYNFMKRRFHWITSMIVTSILFGAMHITAPHLIVGSVFGMLLCMCYELSGSCLVSILMHIMYNMLSLIPTSIFAEHTVLIWFFVVCVLGFLCVEMMIIDKYIPEM